MFVVNPLPYLIFSRYLPARDELRITSVLHAAQRRPALRDAPQEFRLAATS